MTIRTYCGKFDPAVVEGQDVAIPVLLPVYLQVGGLTRRRPARTLDNLLHHGTILSVPAERLIQCQTVMPKQKKINFAARFHLILNLNVWRVL